MLQLTRVVSNGVVALAFASGSPASAQVPVSTCGNFISGDAVLTADLDCSGEPEDSSVITFSSRARLDLAGFTIIGPALSRGVIRCYRACDVVGPGTIVGGRWGIVANRPSGGSPYTNVTAEGVVFQDQLLEAIVGKRVHVIGSLIDNAGRSAVSARSSTTIEGTTISNCCDTAQPTSGSVLGGVAVGANRRARIENSIITGNARGGVLAKRVTSSNSTIAANEIDAAHCATDPFCADVNSGRRPRLRETICGTSYQSETGDAAENWAVCTND